MATTYKKNGDGLLEVTTEMQPQVVVYEKSFLLAQKERLVAELGQVDKLIEECTKLGVVK